MTEEEIAKERAANMKAAELPLSVPPSKKSPPGLKIVKLVAENVKKLSAISITPNGNLVHLTGKNRSGKTSTLDSIWWALTGTRNVQSAPIRTGQEKATIKLDMGELIATRTFKRTDDGSWM